MSIITQTFLWWLVCAISDLTSFELIQVCSQLGTQLGQQQLHQDLSRGGKAEKGPGEGLLIICALRLFSVNEGLSKEFRQQKLHLFQWSIRHIQLFVTFNIGVFPLV